MTLTTLSPRTSRTAATPLTLGLDLTGLGRQDEAGAGTLELAAARAVHGRVATYAAAAAEHGVGFVSLRRSFRLGPADATRLGPAGVTGLDPARVAAGLEVPTLVELSPAAAVRGAAALRTAAAAAVSVAGARAADLAAAWPADGPRLVVEVATVDQAEEAGRFADAVRLRTDDPHWARELRYAVRAAARAAHRAVATLADVYTVLSVEPEVAHERAGLITAVAGGSAPWDGALAVVGTPEGLLQEVAGWVAAGAVDGFIFHPGSVRADVRTLLRDVLPVLRASGAAR